MTITEARPVAGTQRTAGVWHRIWVLAWTARNWWTWDVRHRYYTAHRDGVPVRMALVPVADPGPQEDDPETWWETFFPEDWSGSTVN